MNHENQKPPSSTPGDAELEAQIVAWVAGEASPFLIATLESAIAARPELAVFKRRIEAVHGLVSVAARPDSEPLRLSPERRAKLLHVIGVAETTTSAPVSATASPEKPAAPAKPSVLVMPGAKKRQQPFWTKDWFYSAAACVTISVIGMWMINSVPTTSYEAALMEKEGMAVAQVEFAMEEPSDLDSRLAEPMSTDVASYSVTVDKSVTPTANTVHWSVPRAATVRRMEPKPSMLFAPPVKQKRSTGDLSAPAGAYREVEAPLSVRGYSGTTDDGATGVLSPFEVTAEEDRGYMATNTLAGTRIRTDLKDLSSSVSVVTGQTLKDTGTKDAKQRDNFLSKGKAERAATRSTSYGRAPTPPTAPAISDDKEVVVLSPFEVSDPVKSGFLKKTTRSAGQKQPKRPEPSQTTVGLGPGSLHPQKLYLNIAANSEDVRPEDLARAKRIIDRAREQEPATDGATVAYKSSDTPLPRPAAAPPPASIEEVSAAQEPVSTFSLHVSDVSFKLALAALASGTWPDRATIRPEEFYNAFDYGDPATAAAEKISCRIEQAAHPFAQQRNLVRIAMRVPATGRGAGQPLHLTVLLDTSGSMERPDRRASVRSALATLIGLLGPADRLTLIGFARQPRLLAEALDGNHANQALDLLDRTPAEGGTNLEEALKLGTELARRHFLATAQNRIVLLTDGAANLGNADPDRLSAAVETLRAQRIAFDACGVGLDGLDDTILEALTRKGDGRYYVLNSAEAADAGFARQLAGALRPAAENVKVQVRFNPSRVGRYRLVGFEKHRLREEDFRNDAVDAAELAAEEAAVAVYEIEAKPQGEGELGEVFVRFRDAATKEMIERSWTLPYEARAAAFDRASLNIQLAGTAAMLAEKIRGGPAGDRVELDTLAPIVNALRGRRPDDKQLQELATMFEQLRRLEGK